MKNKVISMLAITCIMETTQIIFNNPWKVKEAIPTFIVFSLVIYFFLIELEDRERRRKNDMD